MFNGDLFNVFKNTFKTFIKKREMVERHKLFWKMAKR